MVYIKEKDIKICKLPVDQNLKYESNVSSVHLSCHTRPSTIHLANLYFDRRMIMATLPL